MKLWRQRGLLRMELVRDHTCSLRKERHGQDEVVFDHQIACDGEWQRIGHELLPDQVARPNSAPIYRSEFHVEGMEVRVSEHLLDTSVESPLAFDGDYQRVHGFMVLPPDYYAGEVGSMP